MIDGKIAFITPWYGEHIPGGAEAELRGLVHHLQEAGVELEVLATCIESCNSDWNENRHPAGWTEENGIRVGRFPADRSFPGHRERVRLLMNHGQPLTREDEEIYCRETENSQALMSWLREHGEEYALLVFIPLLWGVTYYGCQIFPEKSVLIPCAHDQASFYFSCLRENLPRVRGMIFHSEPERMLAERLYGVKGDLFRTMGEGVDTDWQADGKRFREKFGLTEPYILYAGRKSAGKRLDLLLDCFRKYKERHPAPLKLVLIGDDSPEKIQEPDVKDLGFVSQQDKFDAYGGAAFLCNPSEGESFSLVIMESWIAGRPVMANRNCAVTRSFAEESGGGLAFGNFEEFEAGARALLGDEAKAGQMGIAGRNFVLSRFEWDEIVRRYCAYFEQAVRESKK